MKATTTTYGEGILARAYGRSAVRSARQRVKKMILIAAVLVCITSTLSFIAYVLSNLFH